MKQMGFIPGLALVAVAATTPAMAAPEASPVTFDSSVKEAESVTEIIDEYDADYATFLKAYRAAQGPDEKQAVADKLYPHTMAFGARVLKAVGAQPASAESMKGLSWVIQNLPGGEPVAQAWNLVTEHHTQSPALGDLCLSASIGESSEELIDNLRLILDESPHHTVQGKATFALAMQCKSFAETIEDDEEESARLLDEFNGLMEEVMAVYAEVGHFRGSLGNAAKGELFEFNNLRLGMVAPDISGEDLDGVSFKLSDYRGKVVVLDFWGNW